MSLSTLPLSYCTNVHAGRTLEEVLQGLRDYTAAARRQLEAPLAAGLWLAASVVEELEHPDRRQALQEVLAESDLTCYTLNAFPYGDFHSSRVKKNVYLPDWSSPSRLDYTRRCARVLSALLTSGREGSLSTLPLGFKGFPQPTEFADQCVSALLNLAQFLDELHDETGQIIRLAIEPEPCCILETTRETVQFFERLFAVASERGEEEIARRHLGVCFDVCHQAVEFEEISSALQQYSSAEIRLNKVHITCAIEVRQPGTRPEALTELAQYVEARYLHQTFARLADGRVLHRQDLTREFCEAPPEEWAAAEAWRVHFHVPVHRESLGELATTRQDLIEALAGVARLEYAPHLEVETYTWGVLPAAERLSLTEGLVRELRATHQLISEVPRSPAAH